MSSHDSSLAVFAALAAHLQQEPDEAQTARAVVTRMHEVVPQADLVGLCVRTPRGVDTLAASSSVVERADELQHTLGEGPCLDVVEAGGWLRSGDVAGDARYPRWGPRAAELGIGSVLAIAVADREGPMGVLGLYSTETGAFVDRDLVDLALAYGVHATTALVSARRVSTLQTAVSSRHAIGMAQGIVMERYNIDAQQSFDLLRRLSSTTNVKLRDVAAHIVETRTVPQERVD